MRGNYDNTYWNGRGRHEAEYKTAHDRIPSSGRANTMELNLLRVAANYYYDLYNNGLCNLESRKPSAVAYIEDFKEDIIATGAATLDDMRRFLGATEEEAEEMPQSLIDAFERVVDACVLIAYKSLKPAKRKTA